MTQMRWGRGQTGKEGVEQGSDISREEDGSEGDGIGMANPYPLPRLDPSWVNIDLYRYSWGMFQLIYVSC